MDPHWPVMSQPSLEGAAFLETVHNGLLEHPWPYLAGPIWRAGLQEATGYPELREQR